MELRAARARYQDIGIWLGPALAILMLLIGPQGGLDDPAWRTAALGAWMAVWWATEARPVGVTAFIPLIFFAPLGITTIREAAAPYANPIIYLYLGGFLIALAMQRWNLDAEHANNVTATVRNLFNQVRDDWGLNDEHRDIVVWAARLHEIGLQISHGAYHKRGAYILTHADLPGFSRPEQAMLATLVLSHRQRFRMNAFDDLVEPVRLPGVRLCVLLRLAVLFHRGRTDEQVPDLVIKVDKNFVELHFPYGWLDQHPLSQADLGKEFDYLKDANITLLFD